MTRRCNWGARRRRMSSPDRRRPCRRCARHGLVMSRRWAGSAHASVVLLPRTLVLPRMRVSAPRPAVATRSAASRRRRRVLQRGALCDESRRASGRRRPLVFPFASPISTSWRTTSPPSLPPFSPLPPLVPPLLPPSTPPAESRTGSNATCWRGAGADQAPSYPPSLWSASERAGPGRRRKQSNDRSRPNDRGLRTKERTS